MRKRCKCGSTMTIHLRTIIYLNQVKIENVPIYSCENCQFSEIYSEVKEDLTNIIQKLEHPPQKQLLFFDDVNEFAWLMNKVSDQDSFHFSVEDIVKDRINQLLDLLLLAKSMHDQTWIDEIQHRLLQITNHVPLVVDNT